MQKFIDRINALFGVTMMGSSSNDDGDVNEKGKKSKRFRMSKQQHAFFFFVHFIAGVRRENALFHFLSGGREHKTTTFFLFPELR